MDEDVDYSLDTRKSLLSRLRNLGDEESWRVFFNRYWQLLYKVACRAGVDDAGAQDIVQETVIAVARGMPGFHYDPNRGSFRQWLLRITRRRIIDHLRRKYREPVEAHIRPEMLDDDEAFSESITDPAAEKINEIWDEEWERTIFAEAIAKVRLTANPKQFQVFDYVVTKGWATSKVAATLGLNAAQVYIAKHRVAQAVKRAAQKIARQQGRQ